VAFLKEMRRPAGYTMQIVPSNLLAALWIQLGQAVIENKRCRACAACGRWFEIAPPFIRKSRHHCGEACSSRAYRTRKVQALRMNERGESVKEIAEALDSTSATVEMAPAIPRLTPFDL
jgi:ferredoxin